jgi:perosamine synthetase
MKSIPVNSPLLDGNERVYLLECVDTGWISSEGPFIQKFEEQFAAAVGRKHGITVSNGSMALDAVVTALGIQKGDEVILPTFTIISCAAAIVRAGATPVVVDCDPLTWNMTPEGVAAAITTRTKAIMVVHIYGLPVDMDPILDLADKHGLKIIEDAAEVHGQTYKGRPCGTFGDVSTFSFYPNKHVTTGEGGMIVTDDDLLAEKCRSLRNLCFQAKKRFVHEELGWNLRMTNLQAALGLAQLETLEDHLVLKREMGRRYSELLAGLSDVQHPLPQTHYAKNIYWVYGLVLGHSYELDAEGVSRVLAESKVGTRPFFWPMHEQPVFRKMGLFKDASCPVAERLARRGFYIPSGLGLSADDQAMVAERMLSAMANL